MRSFTVGFARNATRRGRRWQVFEVQRKTTNNKKIKPKEIKYIRTSIATPIAAMSAPEGKDGVKAEETVT